MEDDDYARITLRIPKDLHKNLADSAKQTSKSMNAEIIARLEKSFSKDGLGEGLDVKVLSLQVLDMLRKERSILENIVLRNHQAMSNAVAELEVSGENQRALELLQREVRGLRYVIEALDADRKTPEDIRANNMAEFEASDEAAALRGSSKEPEPAKPAVKRITRSVKKQD